MPEVQTAAPFEFQDAHDIRTAIFQALGAASTCWIGEGWHKDVFDSSRAQEIGITLYHFIMSHEQPLLGLATTRELIQELDARAEVAETVGETWPLYKTVGEE